MRSNRLNSEESQMEREDQIWGNLLMVTGHHMVSLCLEIVPSGYTPFIERAV